MTEQTQTVGSESQFSSEGAGAWDGDKTLGERDAPVSMTINAYDNQQLRKRGEGDSNESRKKYTNEWKTTDGDTCNSNNTGLIHAVASEDPDCFYSSTMYTASNDISGSDQSQHSVERESSDDVITSQSRISSFNFSLSSISDQSFELLEEASKGSIRCRDAVRASMGSQKICQTIAEEVREFKLLAHAALPDWLKDNDFLHASHRPPIPCIATCFKSVFAIHSETVNIWTHLIGSLILVGITFWFFVRPCKAPYNWQKILVFMAFFTSAVVCMTFSWLYHTLYCHSVQMSKLFSKLDYCGIAILILGSFVPYLYYGFYCDKTHMMFYILSMVVLSVSCIVLCMWEKFADPSYRPLRTVTFIGLGLSGIVPFCHIALDHGIERGTLYYIVVVAALYIAGALIYAFRVPERFLPGKVDIVGHSHQIFHVMVVLAAIVHYNGIISAADDRIILGECQ